VLISVPSLVEGNWPKPSYRDAFTMLRDDSSLRFERACSSLARRPTITDRPPSTFLTCMRAGSISEATPARGNSAQSLQCSCEFTWTRRRLFGEIPARGTSSTPGAECSTKLLLSQGVVSLRLFAPPTRRSNMSRECFYPKYHDFMNLRRHPVPEETEGRPGVVCPVPSAHLGGAQKRLIT
jgi:hypothetical protein